MIRDIEDFAAGRVLSVVESMAVAALTAPKGRGRNTLHIKVLSGEDLSRLAARMRDIGTAGGGAFFARDAANVELSTAVLLIGTEISPLQLQSCGFCGMGNCETKNTQPHLPCAFNTIDLGIALGSATAVAADNRVDNRIMFSVGKAAKEMLIFNSNVEIIIGICVGASQKNIFFDRQPIQK